MTKNSKNVIQHLNTICPGYSERQLNQKKYYASDVKINEFWGFDLSTVVKYKNSSFWAVKINFDWKIRVRTKAEQKIFDILGKMIEFFWKYAINLICFILDRSATWILNLHERFEKKQKLYLWYEEQFNSVFTKDDYVEMAVMCSSAIKKRPTLAAIMQQHNISKRQAWKVRQILLNRLEFNN